MPKIAIMTLFYGSLNYGGILQAFALSKTIEKQGSCPTVIQYDRFAQKGQCSVVSDVKRYIKCNVLRMSARVYNGEFAAEEESYYLGIIRKKEKKFAAFIDRNISHTKRIYDVNNQNELLEKFDVFVCGSDQVWSPVSGRPSLFLDFVPQNKIKIAYAASVGADVISREYGEKIAPMIERLDAVSVRETGAKKIVNDLLPKKECDVVLDPTLLLGQDEWNYVLKPVKRLKNQKFVLIYMLGKDDDAWERAYEEAKQMNLKIISLPFNNSQYLKRDYLHRDTVLSGIGPGEFIWLIKNAECILTDSFHGTVFSTIFQKKYKIYVRESENKNGSMNGRIDTLRNALGIPMDNLSGCVDFDVVHSKLLQKQKESIEFLRNNI